ncbi:bestrophin-like domain [Humisphaera borealis]|uniref:DUF4239 domain-containing protein n=1 Tax=Humisphaera borealis TaxID=2807512 RepID=A0A7M2X0C1_9BACT|nr:hypothetical protein [Humisphaera borealis]QOV91208.1 DUF4239 domain-containing protein [Humisphaera borealis]
MSPITSAILLSAFLVLGVALFQEVGYRLGKHDALRIKTFASGTGAVEAAVFGLIGLLMAFMFSGSSTRLENRRALIVEEANAIGTAYLRLDLLPTADRDELRPLFREYVDTRLKIYASLRDLDAVQAEQDRSAAQQSVIWSKAVAAVGKAGASPQASLLLVPALNEMFDITTTRTIAAKTHIATLLIVLLCGLVMLGGLLAGYGMAQRGCRSLVHLLVFSVVLGVTVYVIMDFEYPRFGLIRIDSTDEAIQAVRESMK